MSLDRHGARANSQETAAECGTAALDLTRVKSSEASRTRRRASSFAGARVRVTGGPRRGMTGVIVKLHGTTDLIVRFDEDGSTHYVGRNLAECIDGTPLPRRRAPDSALQRVAELFAFGYERVVVYRAPHGTVRVAPWREQRIDAGLIGVYARGCNPADIEADLR